MNYSEKTFAAINAEVRTLLLSAFFLAVATTASNGGLGTIFPLDGGTQLSTRPDGTTLIVETYNECVEPAHVFYREIRVGKIEPGATNQSPFQVDATITSPGCRFPAINPDIAVNLTNAVIAYVDKVSVIFDDADEFSINYSLLDTNASPTNSVMVAGSSDAWINDPTVRVAMNRSGQFAVVYPDQISLPNDSSSYIRGRLFSANGQPIGTNSSFTVSQPSIVSGPVLALAEDDSSVYAWSRADYTGNPSVFSGSSIYARRVDATGTPIGSEFRANTSINSYHSDTEIAIATNGSFVIVWTQSLSDADGVCLQRFDAVGNRLGQEARVSPYNGIDPQVSIIPDGRFIVAWQGQDNDGSGIFAQRFLADGSFYGNTLWVNEGATNSQSKPLLGMADDGTAIVKWTGGTTNFARWVSWDATNQTQILGPRIQSMSPAVSVAAPVTNVTVTFDRLMNAATFATTNAQLVDPVGRVIAVTSVQTTNDQTFSIRFASQSLPGRYHLQVGPTIQDANGLMMDEDGDTIRGEVTDVFFGSFVLTSTANASFPAVEGFESGPDSMTGWSFDSTTTNALIFTTNGTPHGGTNHLFFLHGPMESATVKVNMAGQAGQTNLFLSFWAKDDYYYQPVSVDLSGDGQTWYSILTSYYLPTDYLEFALDLDQLAASNGVAIDSDVYIRFQFDIGSNLYLDDVRIQAGDLPVGPKVVGHLPSQLASSNAYLNTITVTFDKAIDPTSFTGADVILYNPQHSATNPVVVTPVGGSGNTQFNLTFPDQTMRGDYALTVGPNIGDASGHILNQNGNAANGEPNDTYTGTVTFDPTVKTVGEPPILYMETFEAWPPVPTYWSFTTLSRSGTTIDHYSPHSGTNQLLIDTFGGDTTGGAHSSVATLLLDLSGQAGQTNLFLEYWVRQGCNGFLNIDLSNDGQAWNQIYSTFVYYLPPNYAQYSLDLDQMATNASVNLNNSVYVRFRLTIPSGYQSQADGCVYLDDIQILAGNPTRPILANPSNATNGQFQFQLSGPVGNYYVIETSTNLTTWIPLATNLIPGTGSILFTDPFATNYHRRFYRAILR